MSELDVREAIKARLTGNKVLAGLPKGYLQVQYERPLGPHPAEGQTYAFLSSLIRIVEDGPTKLIEEEHHHTTKSVTIYGITPDEFDVHRGNVMFYDSVVAAHGKGSITRLTLEGPHLSIFVKSSSQSFSDKVIASEDFMDELKNL